jgi:lysozyme
MGDFVDITRKQDWLIQSESDLARHEGFREFAYPDPLSKLGKRYKGKNVGWGFVPGDMLLVKLGEKESDGMPWTYGFGFTRNVRPSSRIPLSLASRKLEDEILVHTKILDRLIPSWIKQPLVPKTVLVNLAYNLGNRLEQFHNTLKYFAEGQYHLAARNLSQSLWYKQVGDRAEELVLRLQTGRIPTEYLVVAKPPDFANVISYTDTVPAKE